MENKTTEFKISGNEAICQEDIFNIEKFIEEMKMVKMLDFFKKAVILPTLVALVDIKIYVKFSKKVRNKGTQFFVIFILIELVLIISLVVVIISLSQKAKKTCFLTQRYNYNSQRNY